MAWVGRLPARGLGCTILLQVTSCASGLRPLHAKPPSEAQMAGDVQALPGFRTPDLQWVRVPLTQRWAGMLRSHPASGPHYLNRHRRGSGQQALEGDLVSVLGSEGALTLLACGVAGFLGTARPGRAGQGSGAAVLACGVQGAEWRAARAQARPTQKAGRGPAEGQPAPRPLVPWSTHGEVGASSSSRDFPSRESEGGE